MLKKTELKLLQYFLFSFILFSFLANNVFALENNTDLFLKINGQQKVIVPKEELATWIDTKYLLKYNLNYHSRIENVSYLINHKIIYNLLKTTRQNYSTQKFDLLLIKKKKIATYLENIGEKFNKKPVDATFAIDANNKVSAFSLSQDGSEINIEKSTQAIIDFLSKNKQKRVNNTISLFFETVAPSINSADADNLNITTLIGEGKSNFSGSTKSRIHNIEVASQRFNGLLIKSGEEFSFIKNLGPVDGEHGYKPELVIKNNLTTPEFGGGICQVSTTAFRAAIYSGLKITARRNHAYPVHYYNPQGFDATVYIPKPDLRFKNNTPGYILIQTHIDLEKKELVFDFYGTSDGRKTEIDGPHITSRGAGGAMKTIFTQKVFDKNGNLIIDDSFKSNYASPNKYPHPGQSTTFTKKPKDWSKSQWKKYKKEHHL